MNENLKLNNSKIYHMQLAIENYLDDGKKKTKLIEEVFNDLCSYRMERNNLSFDEELELSNKIINKFEIIFDEIGRENFIFYEDNDINYKRKEK